MSVKDLARGAEGGGLPDWLMTACFGATALWLVSLAVSLLPSQASRTCSPVQNAQAALMILFVALHGAVSNGWRGVAAYVVIALAVAFGLEACSIAWGFPLGFYVHNAAGPKPLGVPLNIPVSYMVGGWPAWVMARLLVRRRPDDASGLSVIATPIVASLILAGYDYPYDPIGSTVLKMWTFRSPSGQFGVPLSNGLGWIVIGWVMFQLFALVEARFPPRRQSPPPRLYWLLPSVVWVATILAYAPWFLMAPGGEVSAGGRTFVVADIYEAGLIAAILTMSPPALIAAFRLYSRP